MDASLVAMVCAAISLFFFFAPLYVLLPFKRQGPRELPFGLAVQRLAPKVTAVVALIVIATVVPAWSAIQEHRTRTIVCAALVLLAAMLTRVDFNELLFRPYPKLSFGPPQSAQLDDTDLVMAISIGGEARAYSIGAIGYHHVFNDLVGGVPIAPSYCCLCHSGMVWKRDIDGQTLTFRLAGIRDGNALLRDNETNTIWQQSSGEAIWGPLKGRQLELIFSDEISFGLWRAEHPDGLILEPHSPSAKLYMNHGWDSFVDKFPQVVDTSTTGIAPRELMLGIAIGSASKAFPLKAVLSAGLIQDRVGTQPVVLVIAADGISARAFLTEAAGTFIRNDKSIRDIETGSVWNFAGRAISGPRTGQTLEPIYVSKHFWFDWQTHHPGTEVFRG
jgi:hypothetical protein